MRIIAVLILMSLSISARCQTTFSFTIPGNVATQEWVKTLVQHKIDSIKAATPPVVSPPPFPSPTIPCKEGPEIKSISGISMNSITVKFHGNNVTEIYWQIVGEDLTRPIRYGIITPDSPTLKLTYDPLSPGRYFVGIMGTKCSGSDIKEFTVK